MAADYTVLVSPRCNTGQALARGENLDRLVEKTDDLRYVHEFIFTRVAQLSLVRFDEQS